MEYLISTVIILIFIAFFLILFKRDPYSYGNILILAVIVFMLSSSLDNSYNLPIRSLTAILCLISVFICFSNIVLLKREGFRLHNLLGFIFLSIYLAVTQVLRNRIIVSCEYMNGVIFMVRLAVCYFECSILAVWILGYAVLTIKPEFDKDFVIILGCSISRKGKLRPLIKQRVNRAIRFVWEQEWEAGKTAYYVPSGGQGKDEPLSEGSAMELYLLSRGAEENEVFAEKESVNTIENLKFSKRMIDSRKKDARVAVVTTNYHVLRSGMLARKQKIDAQVIGSKTKWYFWPNAFFRETVAILMMNFRTHLVVFVIFFILSVLYEIQYI
ncbi:MAG: YdcF family protein [Lachnospiraceae bacterium]|nr:YdcF family protein [Lachnospiraceae bacterium]